MRKLLLRAAVAASALLPAAPARAYGDGPWCLKFSVGRGVSERCDYSTFEACRGEGLRGTSFCIQNSRYLPYWQGRGFDQQPRQTPLRKKHHRH